MATFPLAKAPIISNYVENTQPVVIRSETEGYIKQAVRYSAGYITYDVTYILSDLELSSWRAFYNDDIGRGALEFDWTHPVTGASIQARMVEGAWTLSISADNVNTIKFTLEVFDA